MLQIVWKMLQGANNRMSQKPTKSADSYDAKYPLMDRQVAIIDPRYVVSCQTIHAHEENSCKEHAPCMPSCS